MRRLDLNRRRTAITAGSGRETGVRNCGHKNCLAKEFTPGNACFCSSNVLLLLPKHLPVGLAVGIKMIMFTAFPSGFQFGLSDVPIRTAFLRRGTQVLPNLFDGRSVKKPVAIVDLEYNETRLEDNDMGDDWIVFGVRILGDVEILLNLSTLIGSLSRNLALSCTDVVPNR
jgi:hypothetical protein